MNEIASGAMGFASIGFSVALVIVGLIAWFFINRASVKATEQVRLLEAILEEHKRHNALLRRITDSVAETEKPEGESNDFTRFIPQR
ncbi:YebO family protein [Erwinia mallotivora]|uniref:YebO family protein n=1 Tax=Erwinia mallotivora TaxID=69222 RepID=UPI0035EC682D